MFRDYETFLCVLDKKLNGFFENQKEYICCGKGCSLCCKTGVYPISEVEFLYIKYALERLSGDMRENILSKIRTLKAQKAAESGDKNWTYVCPFLEEEKCLVYTFRPIVCRTFGLPYFDDNNKIKVPSCMFEGLNYSLVYDPQTGQLSDEKFRKSGYKSEPLAFNLSKKFLHHSKLAQLTNMHFGEEKAMIDWF